VAHQLVGCLSPTWCSFKHASCASVQGVNTCRLWLASYRCLSAYALVAAERTLVLSVAPVFVCHAVWQVRDYYSCLFSPRLTIGQYDGVLVVRFIADSTDILQLAIPEVAEHQHQGAGIVTLSLSISTQGCLVIRELRIRPQIVPHGEVPRVLVLTSRPLVISQNRKGFATVLSKP
jgi:hypothetical protein